MNSEEMADKGNCQEPVLEFVSQEYKSWCRALLVPGTDVALLQCKEDCVIIRGGTGGMRRRKLPIKGGC